MDNLHHTLALNIRHRVKLRQNGTVSFSIRLAVFLARGGAYMKLVPFREIELGGDYITNDLHSKPVSVIEY